MSAELIKDITSGFHKIDLERDEILIRNEQGREPPIDYNGLILTEDLITQLDIGLPLSSIQENKIERMFQRELMQIRRQKELARMAQLRKRQSTFVVHSKVSSFPNPRSDYITYEELLSKHLSSLKQIRQHEHSITNTVMLETWNNLHDMTKSLKRGEDFNYSEFLSQMFELLYYLKLY
ncbi:hypothetical protein D3C81_1152320 [compost metagenome]